MRFIRE